MAITLYSAFMHAAVPVIRHNVMQHLIHGMQVPNNFDPTGKYQLRFQGAFSAVEVAVTEEDGCKSDAGSMITMSANVDIDAKMEGGLGTGLLRCCCAGTSIFFNHYRSGL